MTMTMSVLGMTLAGVLVAGIAAAQTAPPSAAAVAALAPTGTLRAAINFGNPVLAQKGPNGEAGGVSGALARELARQLGVPLAVVPFQSAGSVTDALPQAVYDIVFLAIDPVRGQGIGFTRPYVLIEGGYAVRTGAVWRSVESVDAAGVRVAVAKGSAYDLYLTRALKHATLMRFPSGNDAAAAFLAGQGDVLAGVKSPLVAFAAANPGLDVLPGRFMSIEQAMGTIKGRDSAGLAYLEAFVAEMKASGLVARALAESGQHDAEVAP